MFVIGSSGHQTNQYGSAGGQGDGVFIEKESCSQRFGCKKLHVRGFSSIVNDVRFLSYPPSLNACHVTFSI